MPAPHARARSARAVGPRRHALDLGLQRDFGPTDAGFVAARGGRKIAPGRDRRLRRVPGVRRSRRAARRTPRCFPQLAGRTRFGERCGPARGRASRAPTTSETRSRRRRDIPGSGGGGEARDPSGVIPRVAGTLSRAAPKTSCENDPRNPAAPTARNRPRRREAIPASRIDRGRGDPPGVMSRGARALRSDIGGRPSRAIARAKAARDGGRKPRASHKSSV